MKKTVALAENRVEGDAAAAHPRGTRLRAVNELKRQMILDAARRVFEKEGLLGANMRAIAAEAGYAASALYNHYPSKEDIYGELLLQSLDRLNEAVHHGGNDSSSPRRRVERHALAFYDFYLENPRELDLGFYYFQEMRPLGLTPELNDRLNQRLRDALSSVERGLAELGAGPADALRETTALFGHCVGLLLLTHTGRIRMFGQDGRKLFAAYVKKLIQQETP
ncbi:transcriptional regulator, TetR family [Noviherbaspirillum humi]|uniref:Transcriptional regulator, TetR family n=1 Tax=Noviherbaspirillum humi TaxID=1688639 RepID=A0A239BUK7_9BURK|nr:TetR/AcrR family transcriptional regulator [Noviherbaspirillum humi]SNS10853.1 transcriptional regulator, TetR family [Noviherbaspirillum humi]